MKQLKGKYLMVLIAVCGIAAASMGMLTNVSGLFFTPISEELGVGRGSVSLTLTISKGIKDPARWTTGNLSFRKEPNSKSEKVGENILKNSEVELVDLTETTDDSDPKELMGRLLSLFKQVVKSNITEL